MIEFRVMAPRSRFLRLVWPPNRRGQDEAMREAIRVLVENPELPCAVEKRLVPDGWGGDRQRLLGTLEAIGVDINDGI